MASCSIVTEITFVRLPRSKKRRILVKWLKNPRNLVVVTKTATPEEEAAYEQWHRDMEAQRDLVHPR